MRVLAFDPGAENLGWASVGLENGSPYYHMSGIIKMPRGDQPFQQYRIEMTNTLCYWIPSLVDLTEPNFVASEIIPPMGFNNSVQSYLANVAITVVHAIILSGGEIPIQQIGATSVKSQIAIGKKTKKTTKVQVRNGVLQIFPELEQRRKEWSRAPWDEIDAIAVGLTALGVTNKT